MESGFWSLRWTSSDGCRAGCFRSMEAPTARPSSGETALYICGLESDERTMYFGANAGNGYHVWRQHFPGGHPEQLTVGATEEEGIAVSRDGRSLMTSAGIRESAVGYMTYKAIARYPRRLCPCAGAWIRRGLRCRLSLFTRTGRDCFIWCVRKVPGLGIGRALGRRLRFRCQRSSLPGVLMSEFHLAPEGDRLHSQLRTHRELSHAWIAPLDRRTPPKQLTASVSMETAFGSGKGVYVVAREGDQEFLCRLHPGKPYRRRGLPNLFKTS